MYRVKDPVFAMAESFFLDGGSRLENSDLRSLTSISEERAVALLKANDPNVGRCLNECGQERLVRQTGRTEPQSRRLP